MGGFFILAIGSILLAVVNGFVRKATIQYFRDHGEINGLTQIQNHRTDVEYDATGEEVKDKSSKSAIDAPPILFTDVFRWLLEKILRKNLSRRIKRPLVTVGCRIPTFKSPVPG